MSIKTTIRSASGNGAEAKVTDQGQLVVSSFDFSEFYPVTLTTPGVGVELVPPAGGKFFIITTIELYADKFVGTSDAAVSLYTSDTPNSLVVDRLVYKTEIPKFGRVLLTGLNIRINSGKWLNATTNDVNVFTNIAGYYVDN